MRWTRGELEPRRAMTSGDQDSGEGGHRRQTGLVVLLTSSEEELSGKARRESVDEM